MSLPCGCLPSLEGGYGDDGRSGRYSMEWCPMHKAAPEMLRLLQQFVAGYATHGLDECGCGVCEARALLAELEPKEETA